MEYARLLGIRPVLFFLILSFSVLGASGTDKSRPNPADLENLVTNKGTLSPAFSPGIYSYTVSVDVSVTSITVTATPAAATADMTCNGEPLHYGTASSPITLSAGTDTIKILVETKDFSVRQYSIAVKKAIANDATLSSLSISSGALSPAFSPSFTDTYVATVDNAVSTITLTAVPNNSNAKVEMVINGTLSALNNTSAPIPLTFSGNYIQVVVTAQDGTTVVVYGLNIIRTPFTNSYLSNLAVSAGTLSPVFAPNTKLYSLLIDKSVQSVTVAATAQEPHAMVTIDGYTPFVNGTASASIALTASIDTIKIHVDAEDYSSHSYTIIVRRSPSAEATLSNLTLSAGTLSPAFLPGTMTYQTSVGFTDSVITVTPTLADFSATMLINGTAIESGTVSAPFSLAVGDNTITIITTAQDGTTTKTYTINVNRSIPTIFTLPQTNFKLTISSATCKGSNNGSVTIDATQNLSYTATITTGLGVNTAYPFTTSQTISNLAAGKYSLCLIVDHQPDYQQCYDVIITEPKDLALYTTINGSANSVNLALSGGTQYNISLNGLSYTTTSNSITLPLKPGDNDLLVSTDKLCQGTIEKHINFSTKIVPYPDPFQNTLNLNLGNEVMNNVTIEVYSLSYSKLYFSKQYGSQSGVLQLDLSSLQSGVYALKLISDNSESTFKILKQ